MDCIERSGYYGKIGLQCARSCGIVGYQQKLYLPVSEGKEIANTGFRKA